MDRPVAGFQFRWLMLPASWVLLVCALSLPRHGYTGLQMRPDDGRVESVDAGRVVCQIGIAPVKPAEFVVFQLAQFTGGGAGELTE